MLDAVIPCGRGFTQFEMKTGTAVSSREGNNSRLVDIDLHKASTAPSTNTVFIRLE